MNDIDAIVEVKNGVGWIKINRPNVLNSLNIEVVETIYKALEEWRKDKEVSLICMYGDGEKGLCAGGDMRKLYDLRENGVEEYAHEFFTKEYRLDYEIHQYPKPIIVYMNGIVMGGGVGLSVGATHRIVTEKTKWAMPEMNIGFFPDVGASYFLNQMLGHMGSYLALTAKILQASDVLYTGVADYYLEEKNWPELKRNISERTWSHPVGRIEVENLITQYCSSTILPSQLKLQQEKVDLHFKYETLEEIISSLKESSNQGDEWAEKTMNDLLSKSPTSLKVTLRQLLEGKNKALHECLEMEKNIALNFMKGPDFYEGIRAVLVDKDRSPNWDPKVLENVTEEVVNRFFLPYK